MKFFVFHHDKVFQPNFLILIHLCICLVGYKYVTFRLSYGLPHVRIHYLQLFFHLKSRMFVVGWFLDRCFDLILNFFHHFDYLKFYFPLFYHQMYLNFVFDHYFRYYFDLCQGQDHFFDYLHLQVDYFHQLQIDSQFLAETFPLQ